MERERDIYVICGMGRDVTGLISLVTSIISDTKSNIIDMEESVFHGLFSIFLTIDLTESKISGTQFIAKMQAVAHQSGLQIIAEKQSFSPRTRAKRMMRLLLIGADHPGIVSRATFVLANNGVNIDWARMISRGNVFAMEMDMDRATSPHSVSEIEDSVSAEMEKLGIRCFFQVEDLYCKHPRIVVFAISRNLIEKHLREELLAEAGRAAAGDRSTVANLHGLGMDAVKALTAGVRLNSETEDLLHSLKIMGYVVVLIPGGYDPFLDPLRAQACIDHLRCDSLLVEKGKLTGKVTQGEKVAQKRSALIAEVARAEQVSGDNIIVIGDHDPADIILRDCGISVLLDKKTIFALISKGVLTRKQIPALLSAFGPL